MKMLHRFFCLGLFILPAMVFAEETIDQKIARKYQPLNPVKQVVPVAKIGIFNQQPSTVYVYETGKDYESSKRELEQKGMLLIELPKEDLAKNSTDENVKKRDPWKVQGYHASTGEDEEGWQLILSSHQFDGPQGKWIEQTTVRIIAPVSQQAKPTQNLIQFENPKRPN